MVSMLTVVKDVLQVAFVEVEQPVEYVEVELQLVSVEVEVELDALALALGSQPGVFHIYEIKN